MSRTNRGVQARETQIIAQRSSPGVLIEYRVPMIRNALEADASQVPHVPSAQDDSTPTPASSIAVRDGRRRPRAARLGERFGDEPLDVQRSLGPGGAALLDRVEQWFGPAAVDLVSGCG